MANEMEKLDEMVGNLLSAFKPIILNKLNETQDIEERGFEVRRILQDFLDKSTDALILEAEKEIKIKTIDLYKKIKKSFEIKISKLQEEIVSECENYNLKNRFMIIPEEEIPDWVKIKGIIDFFENNKQRLNGIEFTKNKFAICLREGICPQIHEGTNNLNVLYRREQIIYYIISQLLLQVMEQKDIAKLLSTMIERGVNVYSKYYDLVNSINYGYNTYLPLYDSLIKELSNLEDTDEKKETVMDIRLQWYGMSAGNINALNDFNLMVKNEILINNVEGGKQ